MLKSRIENNLLYKWWS